VQPSTLDLTVASDSMAAAGGPQAPASNPQGPAGCAGKHATRLAGGAGTRGQGPRRSKPAGQALIQPGPHSRRLGKHGSRALQPDLAGEFRRGDALVSRRRSHSRRSLHRQGGAAKPRQLAGLTGPQAGAAEHRCEAEGESTESQARGPRLRHRHKPDRSAGVAALAAHGGGAVA